MKNKAMIILLLATIIAVSCKKQNIKDQNLPDFITQVNTLKNRLNEINSNPIFNGPIGAEFSMKMATSGRVLKTDSSEWIEGDSIFLDSLWNWETCAEITEYVDDDGYDVYIMDYGEEGCDEYGYLTKGKVSYRSKYTENSWESEALYENFGDDYFYMNGTHSDIGTWSFSEEDSMDYAGTYAGTEDMIIGFIDENENMQEYKVIGKFKEEYDANSSTILEAEYTYENDEESWYYKVEQALVYLYTCEDVWVPVSGIEKFNTEEGEFIIDYGNGSCDNLAMITHDGETYEYDFGEIDW